MKKELIEQARLMLRRLEDNTGHRDGKCAPTVGGEQGS